MTTLIPRLLSPGIRQPFVVKREHLPALNPPEWTLNSLTDSENIKNNDNHIYYVLYDIINVEIFSRRFPLNSIHINLRKLIEISTL